MLQGRRRDHGRGAAHVPQVREPARGTPDSAMLPWVDVATGSLGQGLPYGVGDRARGQAARPAPVPRSGCSAATARWPRARCGRRSSTPGYEKLDNLIAIIDVNRLGQRGETMHGWDLDSYAKPRRGLRLARDRDRRPRRRGDRRARTPRRSRRPASPTVDRRADDQGQGREGGREQGRLPRQGARRSRGGDRGARRRSATSSIDVAKPEIDGASRIASSVGTLELPSYELGDEVATRKAYGDALHGARRWARRRGRARRRGLELDVRRDLPRRASRTGTSRCTSPSSRWSRPRSGSRCAGGSRSRRRSRRSSRGRTTSSGWRRSSRANIKLVRLARGRLDRRGRAVADGARGPRRVPRRARLDRAVPERREPDGEARRGAWPTWTGSSFLRTTAREHAGDLRARTRSSRSAARTVVRSTGDDVTLDRRRDHAARGAEGRGRARGGGRQRAGDRPLLGQAGRRGDAARSCRGDGRPVRRRRGPLARGRARRRRCCAALADSDERPRVVHLAVREMPGSGTPAELLAAAGIDADHIAAAARELVASTVGATTLTQRARHPVHPHPGGEEEFHPPPAVSVSAPSARV